MLRSLSTLLACFQPPSLLQPQASLLWTFETQRERERDRWNLFLFGHRHGSFSFQLKLAVCLTSLAQRCDRLFESKLSDVDIDVRIVGGCNFSHASWFTTQLPRNNYARSAMPSIYPIFVVFLSSLGRASLLASLIDSWKGSSKVEQQGKDSRFKFRWLLTMSSRICFGSMMIFVHVRTSERQRQMYKPKVETNLELLNMSKG